MRYLESQHRITRKSLNPEEGLITSHIINVHELCIWSRRSEGSYKENKVTHWTPFLKKFLWPTKLQKQKIILFFEVNFIHNKMHLSSVCSLIHSDRCIFLCNHYPKQDIEHFITPGSSLWPCQAYTSIFLSPRRHPETTAIQFLLL